MFKIGCHLSAADGFMAMGVQAVSLGANTFQFFTRNPRGGQARALDFEDIRRYSEYAEKNGIDVILAHCPYTLNACSADESIRKFSKVTMADDLRRLEYIPGAMYNFHPGSHVKQGAEIGIDYIAEQLNEIIKPEQRVMILLETMAGKGSEIGRSFEELRSIIDKVEQKDRLGVCMDTCHIFDGGYDIVNSFEQVMNEFDSIVGLDRLKAVHINDSMNVLGSHKDRHQKIGEGNIGLDAFERIINSDELRDLPFFLETPNDLEGYAQEIKLLKSIRTERI